MKLKCSCGEEFEMETFESKCPKCNMVYGVTPCHAFDPSNIQAAGVDY
jgi:Zn finger protein HypA/HybF involved in hydrogenase expression